MNKRFAWVLLVVFSVAAANCRGKSTVGGGMQRAVAAPAAPSVPTTPAVPSAPGVPTVAGVPGPPTAPSAAAAPNLTGAWSSMFGGATGGGAVAITVTLAQQGNNLTGSYQPVAGTTAHVASGTITGTVSGSTVQGTWSDSDGFTGPFAWSITPDGHGFAGTWTSHTLSGPWTGTRQ